MSDDFDSRLIYRQGRQEANRFLIAIAPYAIGLVIVLSVCGLVSYLTHSFIFQNVTSKVERQNQNADPNYARQVTADFATTYANFQQAHASLVSDTKTAQTFIHVHGDNENKWSLTEKQTYNALFAAATQDYDNEKNLASHWAGLMGNPDKARYVPESCTTVQGDTGPCPQMLAVTDTDPATQLLQPAPLY